MIGGFAPGVMTALGMTLAARSGVLPRMAYAVPMMVYGAGAGYAFGQDSDPISSTLKGAAGAFAGDIVMRGVL